MEETKYLIPMDNLMKCSIICAKTVDPHQTKLYDSCWCVRYSLWKLAFASIIAMSYRSYLRISARVQSTIDLTLRQESVLNQNGLAIIDINVT